MPMIVNGKLMSNREQVSKLTTEDLLAYRDALDRLMLTSSPMIAMTLKQVLQEIEWRHATNPNQRAQP